MPPLRILISRPDRIGDVVLSTPLPREIKKKYPDSYIAILLRPYTKDIYLNNPYIDEIIIRPEGESSLIDELRSIKLLRERKFTHSFMLLPTEKVNWILAAAGIKKRFGVGHKFYQFVTNTKSVYRNKYIPLRHETDYCLDFIRKIGIEPEDLSSEIYLTDQEKARAGEIKAKYSTSKYLIGIHTTSGNSAPNWKTGDYKKLIEMISARPEFKIFITDNAPPEEVSGLNFAEYPNKGSDLRQSIINLSILDLFISASTGPMHICAGLKVPTLSLFCPLTACSPILWGPNGNKSTILMPENGYCSEKCGGDPKNCYFSGNDGITPERVYSELLIQTGINE
jgi:ADP-heptose:LPS heptosyltransferase